MNYKELIAHWGGQSKAAQALGLERQSVNVWKKRRIPSKWQLIAANLSRGRLKADDEAKQDALAPYFKVNGNGSAKKVP
jgi:hypothetical protein